MKTLVKKILKTTLTSLKGYVQFKQNSWDKKSKKVRLKKWKKLVLKPIIFNFESIETNCCFVIFEIFFVDVKKIEKVRLIFFGKS